MPPTEQESPPTLEQREPVVIHSHGATRPQPRWVWLLLVVIIVFFAVGILMVASGLLGGEVDPLPGPTAFTLTP